MMMNSACSSLAPNLQQQAEQSARAAMDDVDLSDEGDEVNPNDGPRKPLTSWSLWITTSLLSTSSVLAWEQCEPSPQDRLSSSRSPGWVLYEEVEEAVRALPHAAADWRL